MKIEFTNAVIDEITTTIADLNAKNTRIVIANKVANLEDQELSAQVRVGQGTNDQKAVTYLNNTRHPRSKYGAKAVIQIENGLLAKALGLHVFAMKAVREELVRRGLAEVYREADRLHIRYFLPEPAAAPANPQTIKPKTTK